MPGVVIADDAEDLRLLVEMALRRDGRLEVLAAVGDGQQAVDAVHRLNPDVVLMDVSMPVMDGLTATREIKASHPTLPILVLTGFADDRVEQEARASGADVFLTKATPMREVVGALIALVPGA